MSARSFALITPGPAWVPGETVFGQDRATLARHLDHMRTLHDSGDLLLGGPEEHGFSGFALFDTASQAEASEHLAADPAVRAGIFRFDLRELSPYFDVYGGVRHAG